MNFVKLTSPNNMPIWIKCDDILRMERPTPEYPNGKCLIVCSSGNHSVTASPEEVLKKIAANVM